MTATVGTGSFVYSADNQWGRLPAGFELGEVAGLAVDDDDQVYVFNRGPHPMAVFDRDGNLLRSWGEGVFRHPHAVDFAWDKALYCTDDGDHTVRKCALDGTVLQVWGVPGQPSPAHSGLPFNRCTHSALAPDGSLYVTDGYGNACVHRFDPTGRLVQSWGTEGTALGEFNVPHNIVCDPGGRLYVADRENHRIQVFDPDGTFHSLHGSGLHRPSGLCLVAAPGEAPTFYVAEIGPYLSSNHGWPGLGPRVTVLSADGATLARIEADPPAGDEPGQFISPHSIAVDSRGDLYVGDVFRTGWPSLFPDRPLPSHLRGLQKLTRVRPDSEVGAPSGS